MDSNTAFTSILLKESHKDVKKHFPKINLRKAAWVYGYGNNSWEFHTVREAGVESFYWNGKAYNAYEARSKGWDAYLRKFFPDDNA